MNKKELDAAVAENRQLKAHLKSAIKECGLLKTELEEAKCCGSCRWWRYFIDKEQVETECEWHGICGLGPSWGCGEWEVRK